MRRLRESVAVRWIALLLFTTFTGACASWQTVEGPDLPARVRVLTTASDTVDLEEPRTQGDSILVGRDTRADATRVIPTDSVLRLEARHASDGAAFLATGIFLAGAALFFAVLGDPSFIGY